jgi:hypothetical protein
MRTNTLLAAATLTVGLSAQTSLTVDPPSFDSSAVILTYSNPGANFFDLTVSSATGITLRAMEIPTQEPAGTVGEIQLWMHASATSHVGIENPAAAPAVSGDPSGWQLMTSGRYTSGGFNVATPSCQNAFTVNVPDTFLAPGTYAMAIVYADVAHQFYGVTTYPAPAGTFADGNVEVSNGATASIPWGAPLGAFAFNGTSYAGVMPDFGLVYNVGNVPHACGEKHLLGSGSGASCASWFDQLQGAASVQAALQGRALRFENTGTGYILSEVSGATFRPASGAETVLAVTNDNDKPFALANLTVPYPTELGGATSSEVWVHANGYFSYTGANGQLPFTPIDPQAAMNQPAFALFACYHDFNPSEAGSGQVWVEEDLSAQPNPTLYITWDGVESYPIGVANPSTVQAQVDLVSGDVVVVYESIDGVGGSAFAGGDDMLIGWSPAGISPPVPERDFAQLGAPGAAGNFTGTLPEVMPLSLNVTGAPLLGSTITFDQAHVPAAVNLGVTLLSDSLVTPLPLEPLGALPGTVAYVGLATSLLFPLVQPNSSVSLPLPNNTALTGMEIFGQSFWFEPQQPAGPLVGLIGSNAVGVKLGNY